MRLLTTHWLGSLATAIAVFISATAACATPSAHYRVKSATTTGTSLVLPVEVGSNDSIGGVIVTLDYDSTEIQYSSVALTSAASSAGFEIVNVNPHCCYSNPPTGTHKRVLVDASGNGINEYFTGTINVLDFTFAKVRCGAHDVVLPTPAALNNASTIGLYPLYYGQGLALYSGTATFQCGGGGGGELEKPRAPIDRVDRATWTTIKELMR